MKKALFLFAALGLGLTSCDKFSKDESGSMIEFAARYGQTVTLQSMDYTVEGAETLGRTDENSAYTEGTLTYKINGEESAKLAFIGGNYPEVVRTTVTAEEREALVEDCDGSSDKKDYKKVVTEPLVYVEDCGYVVSGVIKFFECSTGKWVATFNYGDGTCDDLIAKTTKEYENYMFSMDDYPEWNK